jgi:hypothetical protein
MRVCHWAGIVVGVGVDSSWAGWSWSWDLVLGLGLGLEGEGSIVCWSLFVCYVMNERKRGGSHGRA